MTHNLIKPQPPGMSNERWANFERILREGYVFFSCDLKMKPYLKGLSPKDIDTWARVIIHDHYTDATNEPNADPIERILLDAVSVPTDEEILSLLQNVPTAGLEPLCDVKKRLEEKQRKAQSVTKNREQTSLGKSESFRSSVSAASKDEKMSSTGSRVFQTSHVQIEKNTSVEFSSMASSLATSLLNQKNATEALRSRTASSAEGHFATAPRGVVAPIGPLVSPGRSEVTTPARRALPFRARGGYSRGVTRGEHFSTSSRPLQQAVSTAEQSFTTGSSTPAEEPKPLKNSALVTKQPSKRRKQEHHSSQDVKNCETRHAGEEERAELLKQLQKNKENSEHFEEKHHGLDSASAAHLKYVADSRSQDPNPVPAFPLIHIIETKPFSGNDTSWNQLCVEVDGFNKESTLNSAIGIINEKPRSITVRSREAWAKGRVPNHVYQHVSSFVERIDDIVSNATYSEMHESPSSYRDHMFITVLMPIAHLNRCYVEVRADARSVVMQGKKADVKRALKDLNQYFSDETLTFEIQDTFSSSKESLIKRRDFLRGRFGEAIQLELNFEARTFTIIGPWLTGLKIQDDLYMALD